jgi:hypothetical protein
MGAADTMAALTPPFFFLVTFLLESAHPGYSRMTTTISELVLLPYGWMVTILFCLMGLSLLLVARRLNNAAKNGLAPKLDAALLVLAGFGFFIIAIFPTCQGGRALDTASTIHMLSATCVAGLSPLVCLVLALSLRSTKEYRLIFQGLLASGLTGLGLGAVGFLVLVFELPGLGGVERAITLSGLVGIELIIIYLTRTRTLATRRVYSPRSLGFSFFTPKLARVRQTARPAIYRRR